jgi:hypothetical protein
LSVIASTCKTPESWHAWPVMPVQNYMYVY